MEIIKFKSIPMREIDHAKIKQLSLSTGIKIYVILGRAIDEYIANHPELKESE